MRRREKGGGDEKRGEERRGKEKKGKKVGAVIWNAPWRSDSLGCTPRPSVVSDMRHVQCLTQCVCSMCEL